MAKLRKEDVVTLHVLKEKGSSNTKIARVLGVTEGAVRYHLRRQAGGARDGRKKRSLIEQSGLSRVVARWWEHQLEVLPFNRSPNVQVLWDLLVCEHGYAGSVKSVRKYIRDHFPKPPLRPFRRIETPAGAQSQSDWLEAKIDLGDGPVKVYGFIMVLSHSRKTALVWSRSMNQLNWHRCHNEAFKRMGGIAAVNRIDNLKTGVIRGGGPWGELNPSYLAYAQLMGFHIDPHEPRKPNQKGKAERRVDCVKGLDIMGLCFDGLDHLQAYTDRKIERSEQKLLCPATGRTIAESWQLEKALLRPLPQFMPEPFDLVRDCPVHKDCTIRFEGRTYAVPFQYLDRRLEARGCAHVIQVVDKKSQAIVQQYPRGTDARLLIDPSCYEGRPTATVDAPKPLGRMSKRLQKIMADEPQIRSIEIYDRLAGVAR